MSRDRPGESGERPVAREQGRAGRIGLWLGLVLFAGLIIAPPPDSMRRVVRRQYEPQLSTDIAAALAHRGLTDTDRESDAYRAAEAAAVEVRARAMMAAAAVTALVACWWITVAVPIPATSLVPLVLLPVVGVLPIGETATAYADPNVFLFMGGFVIALGIERWGLHRRIALHVIRLVGTGRSTIVLGFMIASALLSMWISNTATTMMMLPIGMAVIGAVFDLDPSAAAAQRERFAAALMLGIAYAASIGGVATPIGTPPNIVFHGQMGQLFPDAPPIGFATWVVLFLPLVVLFVPAVWLVLTRVTCRFDAGHATGGRRVVGAQLARLGRMSGPERLMLVVFAATALLWMTRSIPVADRDVGWATLLEWLSVDAAGIPRFHADYVKDATVALFMAVLLFVLPAGRDERGRRQALMDWPTARRLPWDILLLFGGGFAIARGFGASGLSHWCGELFAGVGVSSPPGLIATTCFLMTFLTEITSNTATTQVMLPIVAQAARAVHVNPLLLMLPATISASCAFMLPVATPPNAIVFGSGQVSMGRMVRTGIVLNLIGVVLVTLLVYLVVRPLLQIDAAALPDWAR